MTNQTSTSCAETIAELEPRLRALVESGASDAELLDVQRQIEAAKIRLPILLEQEEKARIDDDLRRKQEFAPTAKAAFEAASLGVVFADLFEAVERGVADIARQINRLPEFRQTLADASQRALELSKASCLAFNPANADPQALGLELRKRIRAALYEANITYAHNESMPLSIHFATREQLGVGVI